MLNTLGIVEVRGDGENNWGIRRKLGGKSILEWVVRRATDCLRLDAVVVLCADADEALVRSLVPPDVDVYPTRNRDSLAATVAICTKLAAQSLVHISADNPFVDPVLIDRLVTTADAHPQCDYISYCRGDGRPAILKQLGVLAEWCSVQALKHAARHATSAAEREHAMAYLVGHPERFTARLIPMPTELDREDVRLRIDGEEDWEHAQVIYEALGQEDWDWRRIADLLHSQPELRNRMADLNRAALSA